MKKSWLLIAVLWACGAVSVHADPYSEFQARVRDSLVKPFALDLGGLLGGASFWDGRSLGFPGARLDVNGIIQSRPDKNNLILRDAGVKTFGIPMLEAAVGLPFNFDVVVHGLEVNHVTVIGGGLRYGIFKSGMLTKFMPNLGIAAFGDKVNHGAFKATHFGLTAAASWTLPFVHPFVGAGYDSTRVTVGPGAADPTVIGVSSTAQGSRVTAGVDLVPFPFFRIHAAYILLHGIGGGQFGLGLQF